MRSIGHGAGSAQGAESGNGPAAAHLVHEGAGGQRAEGHGSC
jgi:hypothetical protein